MAEIELLFSQLDGLTLNGVIVPNNLNLALSLSLSLSPRGGGTRQGVVLTDLQSLLDCQ